MKIAFIPSTFLPYVGGAETQTHNVANYLKTDLSQYNGDVDIYFMTQEGLDKAIEYSYKFAHTCRFKEIDDEGFPIQPYGMKTNPYSIIDAADIVFVCPVNTGYSRMLADKKGNYPDRKKFFGINADIKYLATWINTFITRKNRWESPKYIIGESYGGTRVMGLSYELQSSHWMYLNGVIMVSPADYKLLEFDDGQEDAIDSSLHLPYYAATAWYHKMLDQEIQSMDLLAFLPQVEEFTINKLIPAIAKGGFISDKERDEIAEKYSYYSGLDKDFILDYNLDYYQPQCTVLAS